MSLLDLMKRKKNFIHKDIPELQEDLYVLCYEAFISKEMLLLIRSVKYRNTIKENLMGGKDGIYRKG